MLERTLGRGRALLVVLSGACALLTPGTAALARAAELLVVDQRRGEREPRALVSRRVAELAEQGAEAVGDEFHRRAPRS